MSDNTWFLLGLLAGVLDSNYLGISKESFNVYESPSEILSFVIYGEVGRPGTSCNVFVKSKDCNIRFYLIT